MIQDHVNIVQECATALEAIATALSSDKKINDRPLTDDQIAGYLFGIVNVLYRASEEVETK